MKTNQPITIGPKSNIYKLLQERVDHHRAIEEAVNKLAFERAVELSAERRSAANGIAFALAKKFKLI